MKNIILLLVTTVAFGQSPWTREKGKSYVQLGVTGLFYNSYQFDGNKIDLGSDFSDITTQIYAEYGITNKLEANLVLPYKKINVSSTGNPSADISGFGNITLGLKYKVYDSNWKISSGIAYCARTIKIDQNQNLSTGFNATTILPYLSIGSSKNKWYYFANVGYGYMNNNYSDFIKASFEVGYEVIKDGHLIFVFDSRNVINKEAAFLIDDAQWPSYLDRQTFNAIGLKANYEFKKDKFGANFAAIGAAGIDNAPLAPTFNIGVYTKF